MYLGECEGACTFFGFWVFGEGGVGLRVAKLGRKKEAERPSLALLLARVRRPKTEGCADQTSLIGNGRL
jgi:hypothetical protein